MKRIEIEDCKPDFNELKKQYSIIATQIAELKRLVKAKIYNLQKITNKIKELTKQIEDEIEETDKI